MQSLPWLKCTFWKEPARSWGNRIESSTCINTLRIDRLYRIIPVTQNLDAILEWKFFGSLPTAARPCQPQRGHWHWALLLPRLATLYPSPMAASPGINGAKIDVKGWQLEREVAMTQRWPNWRLATSKYFLRWLSDLIRCYPILWDVLSRSVCNALQMDTALQSSCPKVSECCSRV